jgi:hypothetical protein
MPIADCRFPIEQRPRPARMEWQHGAWRGARREVVAVLALVGVSGGVAASARGSALPVPFAFDVVLLSLTLLRLRGSLLDVNSSLLGRYTKMRKITTTTTTAC